MHRAPRLNYIMIHIILEMLEQLQSMVIGTKTVGRYSPRENFIPADNKHSLLYKNGLAWSDQRALSSSILFTQRLTSCFWEAHVKHMTAKTLAEHPSTSKTRVQ